MRRLAFLSLLVISLAFSCEVVSAEGVDSVVQLPENLARQAVPGQLFGPEPPPAPPKLSASSFIGRFHEP